MTAMPRGYPNTSRAPTGSTAERGRLATRQARVRSQSPIPSQMNSYEEIWMRSAGLSEREEERHLLFTVQREGRAGTLAFIG